MDLAEDSAVVPDAVAVHFIGCRQNASIVATGGIIDGTGPLSDFRTVHFQRSTRLTDVEMLTDGWLPENLVVPLDTAKSGTWVRLLTGGSLLRAIRCRFSRSAFRAPSSNVRR